MLKHFDLVVVVVVDAEGCIHEDAWRNMSDWLILLSEIKAVMLSLGKVNSVGVVPAVVTPPSQTEHGFYQIWKISFWPKSRFSKLSKNVIVFQKRKFFFWGGGRQK